MIIKVFCYRNAKVRNFFFLNYSHVLFFIFDLDLDDCFSGHCAYRVFQFDFDLKAFSVKGIWNWRDHRETLVVVVDYHINIGYFLKKLNRVVALAIYNLREDVGPLLFLADFNKMLGYHSLTELGSKVYLTENLEVEN